MKSIQFMKKYGVKQVTKTHLFTPAMTHHVAKGDNTSYRTVAPLLRAPIYRLIDTDVWCE